MRGNMKRSGSLLEKNVARLFRLGGFEPELNKKIDDYEIDVFLKYKSIKRGIECKQYERSSLAIRNLIHEWNSKNRELNFDKILLVLVGCKITDKDRNLARKYGITIWDTKKFNELFDEAIEKRGNIKNILLIEAGLGTADEIDEKIKEIKEKYGCPEWMAVKFIKGKISEKRLQKLPKLPPNVELSQKDFRKFVKNSTWYRIPFRKIVEVMAKYNLKDKEMARILINGSGRYGKKKFSKIKTKKIKLLMDELGLPFSSAERYSKHNLSTLRKVITILKTDTTMSFSQALHKHQKTRKSTK